jgi:hypothetical protein
VREDVSGECRYRGKRVHHCWHCEQSRPFLPVGFHSYILLVI